LDKTGYFLYRDFSSRIKAMITTVIGSYPLSYQELGSDAIKQAVNDQLEAGIDIVSDGQTRYDMIEYFARAIDGYSFEGKSFISGPIGHGRPDVFVADLALAQTLAPNLKGIVTGPVTLVFASKIKAGYKGFHDEGVYLDTARALLEIAQAMVKQGVKWIQIDEPYLSVGAPMDIAKKAIESISTQIKVPVALHVCGKVVPIIDKLLDLKCITLLSHGFKGEDNQSLLHYKPLINSEKQLGLGCVDTKQRRVETVEEIAGLIQLAKSNIPAERLIVHPDCGLEKIPVEKLVIHPDCGLRTMGDRQAARAKMKNMVKAAKLVD
jgi:5-methyltetrahydropteroyltriglutamate--homocysteine methyltransferase